MAPLLLGACGAAPLSALRPAVPLGLEGPDGTEVGLAVEGGTWVDGHERCPKLDRLKCYPGGNLQLWYAQRWGLFQLSFVGSPLLTTGVGANWRVYLVGNEPESRFQLGVDLDAGMLWMGLGLPLGAQLSEHWWLTARPSFSVGPFTSQASTPVGLTYRHPSGWFVLAEAGGGLLASHLPNFSLHSGPYIHASLAVGGRQ